MKHLEKEFKKVSTDIKDKDPLIRVEGIFRVSSLVEKYPELIPQTITLLESLLYDPDEDVSANAEELLNRLHELQKMEQLEPIPSPNFQERVHLEKTLGYFPAMRVFLRFTDTADNSQKLRSRAEIGFSKTSMHLIDVRLSQLLFRGTRGDMEIYQVPEKNDKYFKNGAIITFTEENFHQILEFANQLNIKWYYVLNLTFDLKKISCLSYNTHPGFFEPGSTDLWLVVETRHAPIVLILRKLKFYAWTPAAALVDIETLIKTYGKGLLTKDNLYLMDEFLY